MSTALATRYNDEDPEHAISEAEEQRRAEIRKQAEEMADDAFTLSRWEPLESRLGMAWIWERVSEGMTVNRDDVVDALVDAIGSDTFAGQPPPAWVRRERRIRAEIQRTREPIPTQPEGCALTPRERRDAIQAGRNAHAIDEIARIVGGVQP